jgi:SAM-dependent methyltransferase
MTVKKNQSKATDFWEETIYSQGRHLNLYPFDAVVSFIFRWRPRDKARVETNVLEIGCGAGNNLWFAAREGFQVAGIDGSPAAISFARERFASETLVGDLRVGNFLELPWGNETADLGIDRCSTTCVGFQGQKVAVEEMRRVLRPGGTFFFNGYSDEHTSARSGEPLQDGRIANIRAGTLVGVGVLGFNSKSQIEVLFANGWEILKMEHLRVTDFSAQGTCIHAEWRVVVRKK